MSKAWSAGFPRSHAEDLFCESPMGDAKDLACEPLLGDVEDLACESLLGVVEGLVCDVSDITPMVWPVRSTIWFVMCRNEDALHNV